MASLNRAQVRFGREAECPAEGGGRRVEVVQPGTGPEYFQRLTGQIGPAGVPGDTRCCSREVLGPREPAGRHPVPPAPR